MNYKESTGILKEVKKAKKILVACHRGPDMDSIGSVLAITEVLKKMGKDVTMVCTSKIADTFKFLDGVNEIKGLVNFENFDYSGYDLFVTPDASSWQMVAFNPKAEKPKLKIIVIDHHKTNETFGDINLVDPEVTSVGELLYFMFQDWKIKIDKYIAQDLLTGILGDTGVFAYPGNGKRTLEIAQELMSKGADKDEIILHLFRTMDFNLIKFLGEIIERTEIDEENKFVWSAIPFDIYNKYGKPESGKEIAASMFMQSVKDTDFGLIIVEVRKNYSSLSLRSRTEFDVSVIASEIGGGGHKFASGARIENMKFEKAVKKVLEVARKYAKGSKKV